MACIKTSPAQLATFASFVGFIASFLSFAASLQFLRQQQAVSTPIADTEVPEIIAIRQKVIALERQVEKMNSH